MTGGIPHPEPIPEQLLHQVPVAITVLDQKGRIVFYNRHAPRILDRRPQYRGQDVRRFHQPDSAAKIESFLQTYARGGRQEFAYQVQREGMRFAVRVAPWLEDDRCLGLIQTVMLLGPVAPAEAGDQTG